MKVRLMNMIMIENPNTKEVVVLDKRIKEGWEGLTFPGGKVENFESYGESVIREAKEETDLDIKGIEYVGMISWIYEKNGLNKDLGLLYKTNNYKGELNPYNREGELFWEKYDEFKLMKGKSASMNDILTIYDGKYHEIVMDLVHGEIKRY